MALQALAHQFYPNSRIITDPTDGTKEVQVIRGKNALGTYAAAADKVLTIALVAVAIWMLVSPQMVATFAAAHAPKLAAYLTTKNILIATGLQTSLFIFHNRGYNFPSIANGFKQLGVSGYNMYKNMTNASSTQQP